MGAIHARRRGRHDGHSEVGMLSKVRRFIALRECWSISLPPETLNSPSETRNPGVQENISVTLPCNQFKYVTKIVKSFCLPIY